jgi:Ca2+/Na+ antiporter
MDIGTELNGLAWLEQYVWLILPLIFLGIMWHNILQNHKKHPLSRTMMAALIAYTAFDVLLLIPGVFYSIAFLIAFFCLTFVFFTYLHGWFSHQRDKRCTAYTEGTVSNLRRVTTRNRICYYPTIVFYVDGERYCEESPVSCSHEELGKSCWVKYNPNDPHEITQEQYERNETRVFHVIAVMLLCVAVICLIVGISEMASILKK